ncbi:MAG: hypothetical protein H9893_09695 [Candidatus Niameybacter stercoravium]|nr:hypothetical protein [Candidatus Niameybacter stercoravium]
MKYEGYRRIFLGTLLVLVNIKMGSLVIFPDIVGYIVIAVGIGMLLQEHHHKALRVARCLSWAIVIVEGVTWLLFRGDLRLVGWSEGIMKLVMRYLIIEAEKVSMELKAEKKVWKKKQNIYLLLHTLSLIGLSFRMNAVAISAVFIVVAISYEIYWLNILAQLKQKFKRVP